AGERFKDYAELRQALAPYSSTVPQPATLGLRFLAGVIDLLVVSLFGLCLFLPAGGNPLNYLNFFTQGSWKTMALAASGFSISVLYYALLEGIWGATAGKALCGLRVVGPDKNAPGFGRALVRACIYVVGPALPAWVLYAGNPLAYVTSSNLTSQLIGLSFYVVLGLLFCTVRQRNGMAAVHDLVTRTRVISRVALVARPVLVVSEPAPQAVETRPMVGPYHILESLEAAPGEAWFLGYDLRLLRKVWIHQVPTGAPPVPPAWRNLGRPTRLRWLTGQRSPEKNWDAFEAVSGQPLLRQIEQPQPWSLVRYWLWDLAKELSTAQKDATLPTILALDRIWITSEGRAKLLDFPAPGLAASSLGSTAAAPATPPVLQEGALPRFLGEVAQAALTSKTPEAGQAMEILPARLPLHAREFLKRLPQLGDADAILLALNPLLQRAVLVTRRRRAALVAGCVAFPLFASLALILGLSLIQQWNRSNPGVFELLQVLQQRSSLRFWGAKLPNRPTDR
ncbi:MAG TPA: RDD family protein, partial [Candidatus Sulfotelmatobacter sp.]|nr:RDD family protein [Candidatus Sulfotelmatobacter sp.]